MSRGKPFQACDLTGQSPDNCHWVDMKVQANNRRPAKKEKSRPQRRKRRGQQRKVIHAQYK